MITLESATGLATKSNVAEVATGLNPRTIAGISDPAANPVRILPDVYEQIKNTLTCPEMGGILGADSSGTVVTYHFDATGTTTATQYIPDTKALNCVILDWFQQEVYFVGFVHSHNKRMPQLSWADRNYAQTIKRGCHMDAVFMLLYILETNAFHAYLV